MMFGIISFALEALCNGAILYAIDTINIETLVQACQRLEKLCQNCDRIFYILFFHFNFHFNFKYRPLF